MLWVWVITGQARFDVSLCLLDYAREDLCDASSWGGAERGFIRAAQETGAKAAVLATFSDTIMESAAARLIQGGVAPLAGIDTGLAGIRAAVRIGAAWNRPVHPPLLAGAGRRPGDGVKVLNEAESKERLSRIGVPVPPARVVRSAGEAAAAADALGYPVVVKALGVAHKTEMGGVRLDLGSAEEVSTAVTRLSGLSEAFLVEKMVDEIVAELILGVARDEQFGPYLVVGGGGILVELMRDSAPLLLPVSRDQVRNALDRLKCAPLLKGFRGAPPADLNAVVDAVLAVAAMVETDPSSIVELDINPLMVLAEGRRVVAADALIGVSDECNSETDEIGQ